MILRDHLGILWGLLTYLKTTKKTYIELVTSTNQFTDEAEAALKEAISESKAVFTQS